MQSLQPVNLDPEVLLQTATDKQRVASEIEALVLSEGFSYLEAVSQWMEERSIPENQYQKYVPDTVIERLKAEVIEDRVMKPSVTKENVTSNLDFLYG